MKTTLEWTEHPDSRQATRKDLADFARALGLNVGPRTSVPLLRRLLRAELEKLAAGRVQDEPVEAPRKPDLAVSRDDEGLYVEIEGTRYRGDDLPSEGTWISDSWTYTAIPGHREAEIVWTGDTPSGTCHARLREA